MESFGVLVKVVMMPYNLGLGGRSMKYLLDQYLGLDKHQIKKLKNLKSRWVTVVKGFPMVDTNPKKKRFLEKYNDFVVTDDNQLKFKPLNLLVLPKSKINDDLDEIYEKDDSLGKAIVSLYKYVRRHFINITRADIRTNLQGQTNYQLTKDFKHRVNKPIVSKYPNQIFV